MLTKILQILTVSSCFLLFSFGIVCFLKVFSHPVLLLLTSAHQSDIKDNPSHAQSKNKPHFLHAPSTGFFYRLTLYEFFVDSVESDLICLCTSQAFNASQ